MGLRRSFGLITIVLLLAGGISAADDTPYPVIGEPVLRPDSRFVALPNNEGYVRNDVAVPTGPDDGEWATVLTMEGYDGASRGNAPDGGPNLYLRMDDGELMALRLSFGPPGGGDDGTQANYLFAQASIRGTECSGGHFNLYDHRHAQDGRKIVEWFAKQDWSNEAVGMVGGSFPGQTAYWVAAARPPHLKAVIPSLLHSDIYRDIFMPGGVQNILFPALWTYGLGVAAGPHRVPAGSLGISTPIPSQGNLNRARPLVADEICTQAQASRYAPGDLVQPQLEPVWRGLEGVDNDWYFDHAAINVADNIKIPYYQQNNWQDEQTGPRAAVLFHHINPDPVQVKVCDGDGDETNDPTVTVIPKKFALSSGSHGHGGFYNADRWAWFDMFLRNKCDAKGLLANPDASLRAENSVVNYFETITSDAHTATKSGRAWPFPDTTWDTWNLHESGVLDQAPHAAEEAPDAYLSGIPRRGWLFYEEDRPGEVPSQIPPHLGNDVTQARSLPDNVSYETTELTSDYVIAGPIQLDLWAQMAGTDADFFVTLSDVWPDGSISYVQRGLLKASHRRIDPERSYYVDPSGESCTGSLSCAEQGYRMVQPYRPHTNPQPIFPGDVNKYRIEIFPVGHIFRQHHKILLQVHTPPQVDGLWGYTALLHQPAAVRIYHDAQHPSALQLPVVTPETPGPFAPPGSCKVPDGFPCTPASTLDGAGG